MGTNLLAGAPRRARRCPSGELASLTLATPPRWKSQRRGGGVARARRQRHLRVGNLDYRTQIKGVWANYPQVRDWPVAEGMFFSKADGWLRASDCVGQHGGGQFVPRWPLAAGPLCW